MSKWTPERVREVMESDLTPGVLALRKGNTVCAIGRVLIEMGANPDNLEGCVSVRYALTDAGAPQDVIARWAEVDGYSTLGCADPDVFIKSVEKAGGFEEFSRDVEKYLGGKHGS